MSHSWRGELIDRLRAMADPQPVRGLWPWIATFCAVGLAYSAGSQAAFHWFGAGGVTPTFFPSAGITLAALVLSPHSRWIAVLAAAAVAELVNDLTAGTTSPVVFAYVIANVAEPLIGASLFGFVTRRPDLSARRDLVAFLALPVITAPAVAGVISATGVTLLDEAPVSWPAYVGHWWLGDGLGVLVVAGTILAWRTSVHWGPRRFGLIEPIVMLGIAVVTTAVIFWRDDLRWAYAPLVIFPLIAVRLGTRGVATAGALVALVIAQAISEGSRFWGRFDLTPREGLVYTQLLLVLLIGTMLVLAAEIAGREEAARAFHAERAAHIQEGRARMRSELMTRVITELESIRDHDGRLARLPDLLVPQLADRAVVAPRRPAAAAAAEAPPAVDGVPAPDSALAGAEDLASVWEGRGVLLPGRGNGAGASGMALPLMMSGRVTAALVLASDDGAYDPSDLDFAILLADRVSLLLENAALQDEQRLITERLQRALLPSSLAGHPNLEIAVRYVASSRHLEVGGDWYDTIELADGRIGIAVGDVVGHGLAAAIAMGDLRTALAALAPAAPSPGVLLSRLDRFAATLEGARYSTVCYCILEPRTGAIEYASAGHPPPMVCSPDGTAAFLEGGRSQPICAASDPRPEATVTLSPGSVLVLYSDGLIERRGERLGIGLERLRRAVAGVSSTTVGALCDQVLAALSTGAEPSDDIVLVCTRFAPAEAGRFLQVIPATSAHLRELRTALRAWMEAESVPPEHRVSVLLGIGEACANAIEHAYDGRGPGNIEVEVRCVPDGEVILRIRDYGTWRTAQPDPERGRGTALMKLSSDRFSRRTTAQGTEVVMALSAGQTRVDG